MIIIIIIFFKQMFLLLDLLCMTLLDLGCWEGIRLGNHFFPQQILLLLD